MPRLPALGALFLLALAAAACGDDDVAPGATPSATASASPSPVPEASFPLVVDPSEVYLQDPDGGDPTLIGAFPPYVRLLWSPAGDLAVISRWGSQLTRIDFLHPPDWKGETIPVEGEVSLASWSQDGEHFAVLRSMRRQVAVIVVDSHGGDQQTILQAAGVTRVTSSTSWLSDTGLLVVQGSGRLAEFDVVTGESREFPVGGAVLDGITQPVVSPDRSRIAAVVNRSPSCEEGADAVSVIDVQSGQASDLVTGYCGVKALSWSPDGTRLAFSVITFPLETNGGVFVLDIAGGAPTQLIAGRFVTKVRWSPDGRTLFASAAPCWGCDAIARTWLAVPAAGGPFHEIATGTNSDLSPDTATLAYAHDEAVSLVGTIEQGQVSDLWPSDGDWQIGALAWEPQGNTLAIARSHTFGTRGYAASLDGSTLDRLTTKDSSQATFISPGQRRMAVIDYAAGSVREGSLSIQSLDGSGLVATGLTGVSAVKWAPDGSKLAADAPRSDTLGGRRYLIVAADGETLLDLGLQESQFPVQFGVWSPDGTKLAFGGDRLNIADTSGGRVIQATGPPLSPRAISWTADSSRVVFMNAGEIYSIAADGSDLQQLTSEEAGKTSPALSPDGRSLIYRRGSGVEMRDEVVLHDLESGDLTTVFDEPLDGAGPDEPIAWSPDGERVAFFAAASSGWGIYLANADGSNRTYWAHTATVTELYWLDAETLVFTTELQGL